MAADIKKEYLDRYKQESSALSGAKLDKNKFKVNITQYPSDLPTADNLKHYVLFNINVRGKSKFNQNKIQFEPNKSTIIKILENSKINEKGESYIKYDGSKKFGYSPINGVSIHDNLNEFVVNITNEKSVEKLKKLGIFDEYFTVQKNWMKSIGGG